MSPSLKINQMRMIVSDAYPGMKWKARVAKMAPNQVVAIFNAIQLRANRPMAPKTEEYHQYNLFEYGLEMTNG